MSGMLLSIAGGGTGGHIMPALALADHARRRWPELQVEFIGAEHGLEARLLPERGERHVLLVMHGIKGSRLWRVLRVIAWELPRAVARLWRHWRKTRPQLVVGVGGYASAAAVVAAVLGRIPVVLYEQNALPGVVNRLLAPLCELTMIGFQQAEAHLPAGKCRHTGNILRPELLSCRWQAHTPPRLLVLGGSQGAVFLNNLVPQACALLKAEGRDFIVSHVAGKDDARCRQLLDTYRRAGVKAEVMAFCDDMAALYGSGDLLIARAGAMTVSEVAAVGMPALFVPLPTAADQHQHANARVLADGGAALLLEQDMLSAESLAGQLQLLFDGNRLQAMSRAAAGFACPDAAERQLAVLASWLDGDAIQGCTP